MARHVDFDAAWEEIAPSRAAPSIKVLGEDVELPADKPVALVLLTEQIRDPDARRDVTYERLVAVLRIVFGDIVDRWVASGIGKDRLIALLFTLGGMWDAGGDDEGEAPPPATGEPSSSSAMSSTAGRSSSPTSTASTGST